jgi:DNA-binding NarL/FixJ family response regulator
MAFSKANLEIINRLVGSLDENSSVLMYENIDCFLHPNVSLFIPASGQCKYAITPSHTHPAYSFIYHFESVSELIVEGKSNKQIALEMKRSIRTIEEHRANIMKKMKADNVVDLTKKALNWGMWKE